MINAKQKNTVYILITILTTISGCSVMSPIKNAKTSNSSFDSAVYSGDTITINPGTTGEEQYRVFHQGASSFVSVATVRNSAEQRAVDFCRNKNKTINILQETTSKPPHILGNFPRAEIVFECIQKPSTTQIHHDSNYSRLINLIKLLDSGIINQGEFDNEKSKILNKPL